MLLHLYANYAWPLDAQPKSLANGGLRGHVHAGQVDRRVRDAEEFELEGLMSEDEVSEESAGAAGRKKENGRPTF